MRKLEFRGVCYFIDCLVVEERLRFVIGIELNGFWFRRVRLVRVSCCVFVFVSFLYVRWSWFLFVFLLGFVFFFY